MKIFVFLIMTTLASLAQAYFSTVESGEIIPAGKYKLGAETQFTDGVNLIAHFGAQLTDESSFSALIGTGDTDFQTGAFYKWIPIPDFNDQPALGVKAGAIYARDGTTSFLSFRVHPLISKKFETPNGLFIPYASVPVGLTTGQGKTTFPVQLAVGTEYQHKEVPGWTFGGEFGINAKDANSYIAIFASTLIDEVSK